MKVEWSRVARRVFRGLIFWFVRPQMLPIFLRPVNDTNFSAIAKRRITSGAFPHANKTSRLYRSNCFNFCFFGNVRLNCDHVAEGEKLDPQVSTSLYSNERNKRVTKSESDQRELEKFILNLITNLFNIFTSWFS